MLKPFVEFVDNEMRGELLKNRCDCDDCGQFNQGLGSQQELSFRKQSECRAGLEAATKVLGF